MIATSVCQLRSAATLSSGSISSNWIVERMIFRQLRDRRRDQHGGYGGEGGTAAR
ncbi:hypothetical protein AOX55_00006552 (plasmid) [Sinorhizobium fredii CCBAU 25509]|nr:hypothetical protein AOX55_00006552 [Sinorhizobium fredii CCBAU 25509]